MYSPEFMELSTCHIPSGRKFHSSRLGEDHQRKWYCGPWLGKGGFVCDSRKLSWTVWTLTNVFSYELVGYTDKIDDYLLAMGAPSAFLWVARSLFERFKVSTIGSDEIITFQWTFCKWYFPFTAMLMIDSFNFLLTVESWEREWKFHLGSEFKTFFGRNLGDSSQICNVSSQNVLRCEEQHLINEEWLVHTTFEFYHLGVLRTDKLLYKDDLIVTRFYERLFSLGDISKQPDSRWDAQLDSL